MGRLGLRHSCSSNTARLSRPNASVLAAPPRAAVLAGGARALRLAPLLRVPSCGARLGASQLRRRGSTMVPMAVNSDQMPLASMDATGEASMQ
ncbi:hypothetical protein Rsub_10462, partial [Raphidocelis subcapitata]